MKSCSKHFHSRLSRFFIFLVFAAASSLGLAHPRQPPRATRSRPGSLQPTLNIQADSQGEEKGLYQAQGHVLVTYQDMKLQADEVSYNEKTGEIVARGHIVFSDPRAHLEATEAHYNVRTKQGWFLQGRGYLHAHLRASKRVLHTSNPFYIQAARIVRVSESEYVIEKGRVTTCQTPRKGWVIGVHKARVAPGDKVVSHDAVFRLLNVPVFYSPLMVNSIALQPRRTGFLLPHIGNSGQKGLFLGDGFFWAINPSADLLLGLENYSLRGLGERGQFRAEPSEDSSITVNYFGVNDKGSGPLRTIRAPGESLTVIGNADHLGDGFRGVVNIDYVNSLAFRETWTNNFSEAVTSEAHQNGFLTKNFDAYNLNFDVSRYQDFLSVARKPGNSVIIEHTPGASFSQMDQQVGHTPFYFSFDASADGVARTEPSFETPELSERLDLHPDVSLRSKPFWGFRLIPSLGMDVTRYGTSLKPGGAPFNRVLGEFSVDLQPPSFEKVFSKPFHGYRFKHVIKPDIRYTLVRAADPEDIPDTPLFDETDLRTETDEIEYSVTNTILARKDSPTDSATTPQARDLISWRIAQKYYFDPTFGGALEPGLKNVFMPTLDLTGFAFAQGRRLSPIVSVLKFAPFSHYDTELRTDVSPSGGGVLDAGITSDIHRGSVGLEFTDFFINRTLRLIAPRPTSPASGTLTPVPSLNLLRTVATFGNVDRRGFSGAMGLDYNFAQHLAAQVVGQASYNFGCFGLDFEYRRFDLGPLRRENQYRVALSLSNVGTFGNLKPHERLY